MPVRRVVITWWAAALLVPLAASQPLKQHSSLGWQSSSAKSSKPKYSHANDFLIRGTVFTDKALAFPGVQLRIRRAGEKKVRWQDSSDSRGEFAIRLPQGAEYEMVVHAKGFVDQARSIDTRNATSENNIVFRMEPAKKGKP